MILVTGATGNVGGDLVSQLLAAGHSVRVFTRDAAKANCWGTQIEIAVGDFRNSDSFARAANGTHAIFLLADLTDAERFAAVVGAARGSGAHVVLISAALAELPDSEHGVYYREREEVLCRSGLPWTILRPGNFMSNTYQWIPSIQSEGTVYNPTGNWTDAPIAPEDIAAVAAKCLTSPGQEGRTLGLTGGELLSVPEQVSMLAEAIKRPIRCVDVPVGSAVQYLIRNGMAERTARSVGDFYELTRSGAFSSIKNTCELVTKRKPKNFRTWAKEHAARFS